MTEAFDKDQGGVIVDHTTLIKMAGCSERGLTEVFLVKMGFPQSSVSGTLFTIYINGQNISKSTFQFQFYYFNAVVTLIYSAPTAAENFQYLSPAFGGGQEKLCHLKLVQKLD